MGTVNELLDSHRFLHEEALVVEEVSELQDLLHLPGIEQRSDHTARNRHGALNALLSQTLGSHSRSYLSVNSAISRSSRTLLPGVQYGVGNDVCAVFISYRRRGPFRFGRPTKAIEEPSRHIACRLGSTSDCIRSTRGSVGDT